MTRSARLSGTNRHGDRRIDANAEISKEPGHNRGIDDIESNLGELSVEEVQRKRKKKTNQEGPSNGVVDLSGTEQFSC